MDGAQSHKRRKDVPPSKSKSAKLMHEWLEGKASDDEYTHMKAMKLGGSKAPKGGWKAHLYKVVQKYAEILGDQLYEAVKIAEAHNARVHFTPPYHPELQVTII